MIEKQKKVVYEFRMKLEIMSKCHLALGRVRLDRFFATQIRSEYYYIIINIYNIL